MILLGDIKTKLNKHSEFIAKCRHVRPYLLNNKTGSIEEKKLPVKTVLVKNLGVKVRKVNLSPKVVLRRLSIPESFSKVSDTATGDNMHGRKIKGHQK